MEPPHTQSDTTVTPVAHFLAASLKQPFEYDTLYAALCNLRSHLAQSRSAGFDAATRHNHERLMDIIATEAFISRTAFSISCTAFHSHILHHELLTILAVLCADDSALRVKFAQSWLTAALNFMRTTVNTDDRESPDDQSSAESHEAQSPYFLARDCCRILTAIIDSKETHSYFVDLSTLARCVRYSSDVYLSVKCGEVIFRVTRVHPSALHSAREYLGENAITALDSLMSTHNTLRGMCDVVRRIRARDSEISQSADDTADSRSNAALCVIHISDIAIPPFLCTEGRSIDERKWYHHAAPDGGLIQAFFGKTMVVLDWANQPALTIPYASIKYMKLNRHKQLVMQLKDIPFTLRGIYGDMRANLAVAEGIPIKDFVHLSTDSGTPLAFEELSRGDADTPHFPEIIVSTTHDEYRKMRDAKIQNWISSEMVAEKRRRLETRGAHPASQAAESWSFNTQPCPSENLHADAVSQPSVTRQPLSVPESLPTHVNEWFDEAHPRCISSETATWSVPRADNSYSNEIDPLLHELREMVTSTVNASHKEGQQILNDARSQIHHEIESFHQGSEERYTQYKRTLDKHLGDLRGAQQRMERDMAGLIDKLNIDVQSMAAQHTILAEQFSALETEGADGVQEIEKRQDGRIAAMNEALSKSLCTLGEKLHSAVSSTNPLRFMTQFLANAKRPSFHGNTFHPVEETTRSSPMQ